MLNLISILFGIIFSDKCVFGDLTPTFVEEFDGDTLDYSEWNVIVTGSPHSEELQYYRNSAENIYLEDGNLVIKPIKEKYLGRNYTSGRIYSNYAWRYGRVEVRAKLSNGFGLWPAIWLIPRDRVYGKWPRSGEIDIVETRGNELKTIQNAIHFSSKHKSESMGRIDIPCSIDKFHLYTMDWTPTEIVFRFDDVAYYNIDLDRNFDETFYDTNGAPFDEYFHLILNTAVGGTFLDNPKPSTVWKYPDAEMRVDYVKVYSLDDIADKNCEITDDASITEVCNKIFSANMCGIYVDMHASVCTEEMFTCCDGMGVCEDDVTMDLANKVFSFFGARSGRCDKLLGKWSYTLYDGRAPERECLVRSKATLGGLCRSVKWACSYGKKYADISAECETGYDVFSCCRSGNCDEEQLGEFAGIIFQAFYEKNKHVKSCYFGGSAILSYPRVECSDNYPHSSFVNPRKS